MIQAGRWVHTNECAYNRGDYGYHLNSLYSPYVTIGEMAVKYHQACHAINKSDALRNFTNSWLAECYHEHVTKVYDADIQSLVDPMAHKGVLPSDYKSLILGVDVGQNAQSWIVTAITADDSLQVIDWGEILSVSSEHGQYGISSLFDDLSYPDAAGNLYRPDMCIVDSGYNTNEVYQECLRASIPGSMIPCKGSNTARGAWAWSGIRTIPDAPFNLLLINEFQSKKALLMDVMKNKRLILPAETDGKLIHSFSGQEMIKKKSRMYWKEVADDHWLDGLRYALVAQWVMRAESWNRDKV